MDPEVQISDAGACGLGWLTRRMRWQGCCVAVVVV